MKVLVLKAQVVEIPERVVDAWLKEAHGRYPESYSSDLELADDFLADTWIEYSHLEVLSEDGQRAENAYVVDETVWVEEFKEEQ